MFNPFIPENPENTVYWRPPTRGDIAKGYGVCILYAEFTPDEHQGRQWFKASDGLRYYLPKP